MKDLNKSLIVAKKKKTWLIKHSCVHVKKKSVYLNKCFVFTIFTRASILWRLKHKRNTFLSTAQNFSQQLFYFIFSFLLHSQPKFLFFSFNLLRKDSRQFVPAAWLERLQFGVWEIVCFLFFFNFIFKHLLKGKIEMSAYSKEKSGGGKRTKCVQEQQ